MPENFNTMPKVKPPPPPPPPKPYTRREVLFSTAFDDYVAIYLSEFRKLVKENPERARQIALKQLQDAGIVDAQGKVRSL